MIALNTNIFITYNYKGRMSSAEEKPEEAK